MYLFRRYPSMALGGVGCCEDTRSKTIDEDAETWGRVRVYAVEGSKT